MATKRIHLTIRGRVQGVGFRESARRQAIQLGLTGWVKNLPDGAVEAVAEGDPAHLEQFIGWSHGGPPLAQVLQVQVENGPATGEYAAFQVMR